MAEDSVKTFKRDGVRVNLIANARNALLKMITGWRTTSQNAAFLVLAPDVVSIEPAECPVDSTKLDRKQKGPPCGGAEYVSVRTKTHFRELIRLVAVDKSFKERPMARKTTTEHLETDDAVLFWQNVQRLRRPCLANQPRRSVRLEALKKTSREEKEDEAVVS
jgi:hypothetical protein